MDVILGDYFKNKNPVVNIPWALSDSNLKFDIKENYKRERGNIINYSRDRNGYRSTSNIKKPIILTIGGSTTDQRLVDDLSTWQALLNKNPTFSKFNIINGGVDGQSSYGHLYSIDKWHSVSLPNKEVKYIIYYFGVNDRLILNKGKKYVLSVTQSLKEKIQFYLSNNSFFYKKIKKIQSKYVKAKNDTEVMWIHQPRDYPFLNPGETKSLTNKKYAGEKAYYEIIKKLAIESKLKFPNSRTIFVQQQAPGCNYVNKNTVLDRLPKEINIPSFCIDLMNIYRIQNLAVEQLPMEYKAFFIRNVQREYYF